MALKNAPAVAASPSDALMAGFKKDMEQIIPYLEALLPKTLVPRFMRMAQLAVLRDQKLLECSKKSLLLAILWCAQKNLEPGVEDGAWLIPFKGKVVPIPGYKGLINKSVEYDAAKAVDAMAVFEHDDFFYCYGLDPRLEHTPPKLGDDRGELVGAYVIITLPNGDKKFRVMDWPSIEKVRNSSAAWKAAPNTGPWHEWTEGMALKTVIKNGLKTVPMAPDLRELLAQDGMIEAGAGIGALLAEVGAEVPEELKGAETSPPGEEPDKGKGADTTAFDLLVSKKLESLDDVAFKLKMEHLQENLKISAKNSKKTIPHFKEMAASFFEPYHSTKHNQDMPGFWQTFLNWEAERYPTTTPEAQAAATVEPGAGLEPGAEAEAGEPGGPDEPGEPSPENDPFPPAVVPIFADRKKALVMKILGKPIPLVDLGLGTLDDITPENIEIIEGKVEPLVAKKKK